MGVSHMLKFQVPISRFEEVESRGFSQTKSNFKSSRIKSQTKANSDHHIGD